MEGERNPSLVRDYHFALLPGMIKEQRPDARVAILASINRGLRDLSWARIWTACWEGLIGFHLQAIATTS
jgi:hypothetical protein